MTGKVYLITGSNSGVGFEASRQLAEREDTSKVYLACRSKTKAETAIKTLVEDGVDNEKLEFIPFDGLASKEEIKNSIESLNQRVDGVILNAGGFGSDASGEPRPPNGAIESVQSNLIGHIHLVEILMDKTLLGEQSRLIFIASETARGSLGSPVTKWDDNLASYTGKLNGSYYKRYDPVMGYGAAKAMGCLYFAAWARRHKIRVISISPGGTDGTNLMLQEATPGFVKCIMPTAVRVLSRFGFFNTLEQGAKVYVDAVTDEFDHYPNGTFLAATSGVNGPLGPQQDVAGGEFLGDIAKQDLAYEAVQAFL